MEYKICNIRLEPNQFETEKINILFDVAFSKPTKMVVINCIAWFDRKMLYKIESINPEFYNYYTKTMSTIDKWGFVEVSTIEAMGPDAMPMWVQILDKILYEDVDFMQRIYDYELKHGNMNKSSKIELSENAQKIVEELDESFNALQNETKRRNEFCEKAEKQIRALATEMYPEILDLEAKKLKEFKHLFALEISNMNSKLVSFLGNME